MNKRISEIFKRLPVIAITLVATAAILVSTSMADYIYADNYLNGLEKHYNSATNENLIRTDTLIKATQDPEWFGNDENGMNAKDAIGATILTAVEDPYQWDGGYCVGHVRPYTGFDSDTFDYGQTVSKIVNIIDVNNNTEGNQIKVWRMNNDEPLTYDFSWTGNDEQGNEYNVKPLLMLAYLARGANGGFDGQKYGVETEPRGNSTSYKVGMEILFKHGTYGRWLQNLGISEYFKPKQFAGDYTSDLWMHSGDRPLLTKSETEAENLIRNGTLSNARITSQNAHVEAVKKDGNTYIGPYKLKVENCEIGTIEVDGQQIGEVYTNIFESKNVESISIGDDGMTEEFYIKVEKGTKKIDSIKVYAKNEVVTSMKARILLVSATTNQNFMIYKTDDVKERPNAELPAPEKIVSTGKMEIIKKDKDNRDLDFREIKFKIRQQDVTNPNEGWVTGKDENGNTTFGNYESAHDFKIDKNEKDQENVTIGRVTELDNYEFEIAKYEVYETEIPDQLKEYYQLTNKNLPVNMMDYMQNKGEKIDYIGEVEIKEENEGLTSVTAENNQAYGKLVIDKKDAETQEAINGIKFKLYKMGTDTQKGYWVEIEEAKDEQGNDIWKAKDNVNTTFESAGELESGKTGVDGQTQIVRHLPIGDYKIYETDLNGHEDVYPAIGTSTVDGQDVIADEKDTVTVTEAADPTSNSEPVYKKVENTKDIETPPVGHIKIVKTDKDGRSAEVLGGEKGFAGIKFKIQKEGTGGANGSNWVKLDKDNKVTSDGYFGEAYEFVTNKEGYAEYTDANGDQHDLSDLDFECGIKYFIYETEIPEQLKDYYNLPMANIQTSYQNWERKEFKKVKEFELNEESTETTTVTVENAQDFGNLKIYKTNVKDGDPVEGIQFKLFKHTTALQEGYWVQFEKDENGKYKTDEDGKVIVKNIKDYGFKEIQDGSFTKIYPITDFENADVLTVNKEGFTEELKRLPIGEYDIFETSVGGHEDIYGELEDYTLGTVSSNYNPDEREEKTVKGKFVKENVTVEAYIEGGNQEGVEITEEVTNVKYGSLQIEKANFKNGTPVGGIQFKLYKNSEEGKKNGYYVQFEKDENGDYKIDDDGNLIAKADSGADINSADPLTVNGKTGKTEILGHLPKGEYTILETDLGGHEDLFENIIDIEFNGQTIHAINKGPVTVETDTDEAKKIPVTLKTVPNEEQKYGHLRIIKKDANERTAKELSEDKGFAGIKFKIRKDGANGVDGANWLRFNDDNKITYDGYFNEAYEFVTNFDGKVQYEDADGKLQDLSKLNFELGTKYVIYETEIPEQLKDYYNLPSASITIRNQEDQILTTETNKFKRVKEVELKEESTEPTTVTVENAQDFGNLRIFKTNYNDEDPVDGIKFKLYKHATALQEGYWVQFEKDENEKYKTDEDGKVIVKNRKDYETKEIPSLDGESTIVYAITDFDHADELTVDGKTGYTEELKRLPIGEYDIFETSVGGHEDIYGELEDYKLGSGQVVKGKFVKENVKVEAYIEGGNQAGVEIAKEDKITKEVTNTKITIEPEYGSLYVYKTNAETGNPIDGIEFKLYKYPEKGTERGYWVVTENSNSN
ncbi:MAG: hypothetical protein IKF38_03300, partial [Clostridia bacterium]|nr:hypothetical protein [Clostridia bacterium]